MLLLSALTRPEGFLVFAILAGLAFLFSLGSGNKAPLWKVLGALLVFIIPFGLYFFWRYRYFGYPLPNTFYAKTGGGLAQYIRGAKYSILFGLLYLVPLAPVLLTLLWECGLKGFLTIPKTFLMLMSELEKHIGLVVCSLVSLVYTFYIIYVGGDYMAMFRFFVPLLPLLYLIFGLLTFWLYQEIARNPYKLGITNWLIIFAGALTLLQSTPLEQAIFGKPWFMHGTYRGVQHERWHVARNTLVGKFFRGYISDEDESLAVLGIGIIPFMNDITIHSFHGIVDPYIAHLKTGKPIGEGIPGHEKVDYVSVILKKPTYIMVDTGDLYPELQPFPDYPDEVDAFVRENYELKGAWLDDRVNQEEGYLMFLELKEP
jgi:arabinofuranosyltransferase